MFFFSLYQASVKHLPSPMEQRVVSPGVPPPPSWLPAAQPPPVCLLTGNSRERPNFVYSNSVFIPRRKANSSFFFFLLAVFFLSCSRRWDNFCLRHKLNLKPTPPPQKIKNKKGKEKSKILLIIHRLTVSGFMGTISSVFKTRQPPNENS